MSQQPVSSAAPAFSNSPAPRRSFMAQFLAGAVGVLVGVVPAVVGLATFLNPLRKSVQEKQRPEGSDAEGFYDVTALAALNATPQSFKIIADRRDAWNVFPQEAIGAVFLALDGKNDIRAFNVSCPHAGCAVDYRGGKQAFHCPCHNSSFALDGTRSPESPSARDLDSLETKVSPDGRVWVKYQNFKAGEKEKKVV
jgi:quinol---cytochrome c reductase iron-sulfur subunit, bacillus type